MKVLFNLDFRFFRELKIGHFILSYLGSKRIKYFPQKKPFFRRFRRFGYEEVEKIVNILI